MPPEHVEMPGAAVVGNEMYPRLENRPPASVRRDHGGYRVDDLRAADAKALNVRPGQKPQPDPLRAHPLIIFGRTLTPDHPVIGRPMVSVPSSGPQGLASTRRGSRAGLMA